MRERASRLRPGRLFFSLFAIRGAGSELAIPELVTAIAKALTPAALTWSPQTLQENWSDRLSERNLHKAWGGPSLRGLGRVMPNQYGARHSRLQLHRAAARDMSIISRIELGPSRRDPQGITLRAHGDERCASDVTRQAGTSNDSVPQGASATGSLTVSHRRSPRHGGDGNTARSESSVAPERDCLHPEDRRSTQVPS